MTKAKLRQTSFKWHRKLIWIGLLALLLFVVSAVTHPILSWTGPKAAKFRPPAMSLQSSELNGVSAILKRHNIEQVSVVKIVPSEGRNLLQVTQNATQARRYFDLNSELELPNHDKSHAIWLANYYLGNQAARQPSDIEFKTQFDSEYPWVNRLLPVYKIQFDNDEASSVFVYTELNALAGIGNNYKTRLQAVFRNLHTWSWLSGFESARLIIMSLLLVCLILLTLAGIGLLLMLRGRKSMPISSRIHRIAAYIIAIPTLGFCASGFYHLLHYGLVDTHRGMVAPQTLDLRSLTTKDAFKELPNKALNHASLMMHQNQLFYRLSLSADKGKTNNAMPAGGEHAHHAKPTDRQQRNKRFDGQVGEKGGLYYSASTGLRASLNDKDTAIAFASEHLKLETSSVKEAQLITRFGMHYDFRNKRLPVWQVDFDSAKGDKVFIDPATGVMVDRLVNRDRYEGYAFSFLHKWNFLTPFLGRFWRDVAVVIMMGLILLVAGLGVSMRLKAKPIQSR